MAPNGSVMILVPAGSDLKEGMAEPFNLYCSRGRSRPDKGTHPRRYWDCGRQPEPALKESGPNRIENES